MNQKEWTALTEGLAFTIIGMMQAEDLMEIREILQARKAAGEEVEFEESDLDLRISPDKAYGKAGTILVVGLPLGSPARVRNQDPMRSYVSMFALGEDYHATFKRELDVFLARLATRGIEATAQVDTGPLLERAFARLAGAGFQGKNTTIIHPKWGSLFFLGLVILEEVSETEWELVEDGCGDCEICRKACPTQALERPYRMQVNRCLSYWTQAKGHVPFDIRERWGNLIYGCDQCQRVCPYNRDRFEKEKRLEANSSSELLLIEIAEMSKKEFSNWFAHTAAGWRGRNVLRRNALLALARPVCREAFERVILLLNDPSPMVRATAGWTLVRMDDCQGRDLVGEALEQEKDQFVREEWTLVLNWKSSEKMTEL